MLLKLLPYGLIWLVFVLIYLVIPNTRVKFLPAIIGGLVAGAVFQLVQGGYINAQVFLSKYNAIYGSFAALPLLLIWMQLSWIIVLFGAQLAYAQQYVGRHAVAVDYSRISLNLQKKYALYVLWALIRQFHKGGATLSQPELAQQLDLPYGIVARAIDTLLRCGMISAVIVDSQEGIGYQPARDIHAISVSDVLQALDKAGDDELPDNSGGDFQRIFDAVEALADTIRHSPTDLLVKDI
jgi:membrane protein